MDTPVDTPVPPDTQWSRWEVFKQDAPGKPHQAVGSVHAVGAEHALLTARSVFVRRPSAVSLWVAPELELLTVTAEALRARPPAPDRGEARFQVFLKTSHKQSLAFADHAGEVQAGSLEGALHEALAAFSEGALAWLIVPEEAIARSPEGAQASWFEPAKTKTYKQQSAYGAVRAKKGAQGGRAA